MGTVGGVKPARARGEGARLASRGGWQRFTWPRRARAVGARVEGQLEVRVGSSFVRLDSVKETERKLLNGGDECLVGKCE